MILDKKLYLCFNGMKSDKYENITGDILSPCRIVKSKYGNAYNDACKPEGVNCGGTV